MSRAVVVAARGWLGTPYRHQASLKGAGCDCLGLVRGVWREVLGAEPCPVPPYGADWRDPSHADALMAAAMAHLVPHRGDLEPGTVVVFRLHRAIPPKHCGIMVGPDRFIHAQERLGVVEAALTPPWRRRVAGCFRYPGP